MSTKNQNAEDKKIDSGCTREECQALQQQCDDYLAGWKRAKADYSNLKKEQDTRNKEVVEYAHAHVVSEFISVYDNFKMAAAHKPASDDKEWQNWAVGIDHIQKQFLDVLKRFNIEEIETLGKTFDPLQHEAVGDEEVEGKQPGVIIKEMKPGYTLNGKVVVPAKVILAK